MRRNQMTASHMRPSRPHRSISSGLCKLGLALGLTGLFSSAANAQTFVTFSIDYQGPPIGAPDSCTGIVGLTEGDILAPFGGVPGPGLPPPCIYIPAAPGGLGLPLWVPGGHAPGMPGRIEVDALSYGREPLLLKPTVGGVLHWWFSVDEFAFGTGAPMPPNVFTEGALGNREAAADIFTDLGLGTGPMCGMPAAAGNTDVIDGNGFAPFGGPGLGLIEPIMPVPGVPDSGANLDALCMNVNRANPFPVYFSLDGPFFDPAEGVPNTNSALFNGGFVGGDVLVTRAPGMAPVVFIPAFMLGLDLFGPNTDDLDALILRENGDGIYQPSLAPFDWQTGATDMVLFSVRRGSAVIGMPDSRCGRPIEPGDILSPPPGAGMPPGIWIPAEALGLATRRMGFNNADDLDALDVTCQLDGDLDFNRVVDISDLAILLSNYGCAGPGCIGDVNKDGFTNLVDLSILLSNYGKRC